MEARREIVVSPDAVGALPADAQNKIRLVRQYRQAIDRLTIEIPAGILEPHETPLETASRECEEGIGMRSRSLKSLFSYYHSVVFSTGKIAVHLGVDLIDSPLHPVAQGEFTEVVMLPFSDVCQIILEGEIVDSKTILAFLGINRPLANIAKTAT